MKKNKKLIFCKFFKKELEQLENVPYPGQIGKKIYKEISKLAWKKWMIHQTMFINEKNLSTFSLTDQQKIKKEMIHFLFKK